MPIEDKINLLTINFYKNKIALFIILNHYS